MKLKAKLFLYPLLERFCSKASTKLRRLAERFAICMWCGENRYTGKPCVKLKLIARLDDEQLAHFNKTGELPAGWAEAAKEN